MERKRHIGNDIVVIVFVDGEDEAYQTALQFNPDSIKSHFNHIFALVTYSKARDSYKLVIHSAESVPNFGPPLPPTGEFNDHSAFRDFLLAKCKIMDGWMDGWTDGWMDRWMDGWTDGQDPMGR